MLFKTRPPQVVMCKARLGLKAPAWARLSTAWASQNLKPGRHFGPGSAQAWPGLGCGFSTYSTCHTYSTACMATSYQYTVLLCQNPLHSQIHYQHYIIGPKNSHQHLYVHPHQCAQCPIS